MTRVEAGTALQSLSREGLLEQAKLRREVLTAMLNGLHSAPTLAHAIEVLRLHAGFLLELGLHDEHARLQAYARAVLADVGRIQGEADALEAASSQEQK